MFGGSSSNQNDGASKKKPGPKPGSKRDPHASRPGPRRLMDLPGSATSSRMKEDREVYASTNDSVVSVNSNTLTTNIAAASDHNENGIILPNTIMDQNMEEDVGTLDEEILDVATMQDDIVEGTESDAECAKIALIK
ncbi:hypothetical protein INT47_012150 [Mucor saturninus]|uniref:Uncharacterized protein n=1 Tax=Mucor saturninus TaxID=64648 RepID=A0A8H7URN1_9FUNG|nr:hypothetical protein INT47_012150 [Mucor saturninus]